MAKSETTATYDEEAELRRMTEVNLDEPDDEEAGKEIALRGGMMKVGGQWSTAVSNIEARNPMARAQMLVQEARAAGESFFYGWGAGKNRIEGAAVGLAMAAARIWGNCAVDFKEMQETEDSWVFTSYFIDLETGFTLGRQFRQSKHSVVHGKHDAERKDDMRFQIGQSKAARNVVLNALPRWMIKRAVEAAKEGVRKRISDYIKKIDADGGNGMNAAIELCLRGLKKHGVTEEAVLDKFQKPNLDGLILDDIVVMRGDLYALDENQDRPESIYPLLKEATGKAKGAATSSVNDKLKGGDDKKPETAKPAFEWEACRKAFETAETVEAVRALYLELTGPQSTQGFDAAEAKRVQDFAMDAEERLKPKPKEEPKQEAKAAATGDEAKQPEKAKVEKAPEKPAEPAKPSKAAESTDPLDGISSSGEPEEGFQLGQQPPKGNGKKK